MSAVTAYLSFNLLLVAAYLLLRATHKWRGFSARAELRLHYALIVVAGTIVLARPLWPEVNVLPPIARVWNERVSSQHPFTDRPQLAVVGQPARQVSEAKTQFGLDLSLVVLAIALLRLNSAVQQLRKLKKEALAVRHLGGVSLYVRDRLPSPL